MKNIKCAVIAVLISVSSASLAAPILNENAAINSYVTIYKDSADPNLYYFAPQYVGVCLDEASFPIFSFSQYKKTVFSPTRGIVMATLCVRQHMAEMREALVKVKQANPAAKFAGVAFTSSELVLKDEVIRALVDENACNHTAGVIGQEQACSFILNPRGKDVFVKKLQAGLAIILQFSYVIEGFVRTEKGLETAKREFGVAAYLTKADFLRQKSKDEKISIFP